ncbi:preprotein translocase subunit SecY [Coxiella endosymbiont of Amblyomma americanum]|uniref:preprotein translocase subunit SecY n=1 Tax=Coxiella endosymbiont of Amblyomma americanum TaxID=325775 RepID=UPI0005800E8E|nr:preprotein translocase subunit SecY [Coxiella endosymbiont of Amblyomma americanum]AJC50443.1 preprotein translocase subunit SecY [Coxiella endosymbiont of Amblyomma americanum]AUJ58783.1 preprotein translocase subunit SecY [Coxiella-like endosymbiont of Amblyomma americanum]
MANKKFNNTSSSLSQGGLSELKRRLLFVLFGVFVYRLGTYIPVPGLNPIRLSMLFHQHELGFLGMFNMFSGGALSRMTIFALGIMPYISASIIIQMYSQISPKMQSLRKEGESGRRRVNQYIRYGTVILSLLQSIFMTKWLVSSSHVVMHPDCSFYLTTVITLVTGTMFLMWLGEQMTERGIGNGTSLIIFSSIASRFPVAVSQVFMQVRQGQIPMLTSFFLLTIVIVVTLIVVFFERAQRRITINYAKRQQGRKLYAAQCSHLPLKINMSGIIPVIFAQSIILFPGAVAKFMASIKELWWLDNISLALSNGQPAYIIIFSMAVIFFSFFYTILVFNPKETAENLKKTGAFISGIRPGIQTANYISKVMTRLTLVGSVYLALVALLPQFLILTWNIPFYFGGTSLLIVVVVVMDFIAQVQAHVMSYQYESLMKKSGVRGAGFGLIR